MLFGATLGGMMVLMLGSTRRRLGAAQDECKTSVQRRDHESGRNQGSQAQHSENGQGRPTRSLDVPHSSHSGQRVLKVAKLFSRCYQVRRRLPGSNSSGEVLSREIPVDELVEHRIHIVCAPVLVVQVIRVLPHIDGQQRLLTAGDR